MMTRRGFFGAISACGLAAASSSSPPPSPPPIIIPMAALDKDALSLTMEEYRLKL
jgi:hypothetical protein